MALAKQNKETMLVYQDGAYINTLDRTDPKLSPPVVLVVVPVAEEGSDSKYVLYSKEKDNSFLSVIETEYHLWFYWLKTNPAGSILNNLLWENEKVWRCVSPTSALPSVSPGMWEEVNDSRISDFDNPAADLLKKTDQYFKAMYSVSTGDFSLLNLGKHEFKIKYNYGKINKVILYYYDYTIHSSYSVDSDTFTITMPHDGAWVLQVETTNTNSEKKTNYIEIYDFTDIEACYLKLLKDVICDCMDCDDCPGENYTRAVTLALLYTTIRDILYSDRMVAGGFASTETLRATYIQTYGLLIKKLSLMTSRCTCED